jgi:hypothetical protein
MGELTLKFGEAATRHLKSLPSPSGAVVLRDPIRDHVSQDGDIPTPLPSGVVVAPC